VKFEKPDKTAETRAESSAGSWLDANGSPPKDAEESLIRDVESRLLGLNDPSEEEKHANRIAKWGESTPRTRANSRPIT
jgi:hypothetical protein